MKGLPLRKWVLMTVGLISVGIGLVGIFVPLLPTTVFLLIGAACFARSSERLHDWLVGHPQLGPYINNYRRHRAITQRARAMALLMLWAAIGTSALFATDQWWLRVLLIAIAIGVSIHLMRLKTMTREMSLSLDASADRD